MNTPARPSIWKALLTDPILFIGLAGLGSAIGLVLKHRVSLEFLPPVHTAMFGGLLLGTIVFRILHQLCRAKGLTHPSVILRVLRSCPALLILATAIPLYQLYRDLPRIRELTARKELLLLGIVTWGGSGYLPQIEIPPRKLSQATRHLARLPIKRLRLAIQGDPRTSEKLSDLSPLSRLHTLHQLFLDNNDVVDLSPLGNLTNLTSLSLSNNRITDASPLSNLSGLTALTLYSNHISDTSFFAKLPNLTYLNVAENDVTEALPLAGLSKITELVLADNQIADPAPLGGLTGLYRLDLKGNPIAREDFDQLSERLPDCNIEF